MNTFEQYESEVRSYCRNFPAVFSSAKGPWMVDTSGQTHQISPGTLYALNANDHHLLEANQGVAMRMVCVFNPPLTGAEVHDETGAYALES